ncbi:MAG: LacI family DNA-binding transcriptional regulator [Geminicoccaceae bacterium]
MATIYDVAREAGVSAATVSHVINNSRFVSLEKRERVQEAIRKLRYRRDAIARSLRQSRTSSIGLMISDITNPYFADVVRGVEDVVYGRGDRYNLILCNTEEDPAREAAYLEVLQEKRIDGLVMAPAGGNHEVLQELLDDGMPLVMVDRHLPGVAADAVIVDNRDAARRLVTHLLTLGRSRIAVLRARLLVSTIDDRIDGWRDALLAAGETPDEDAIVVSESAIDEALAAGRSLLDRGVWPDAVFCTNNFMTLGMMRALAERRLRCPEDVAVVSFDDFPWSTGFRPLLTAVAQPAYEIGRTAAEMLFDRIDGVRAGPAEERVLPTTMIVRESCGAELPRGGRRRSG